MNQVTQARNLMIFLGNADIVIFNDNILILKIFNILSNRLFIKYN